MTAKVKKGDTVMVLTGKDKGKKGEVLKMLCCCQVASAWTRNA